eukprot:1310584-Alexandrium_andersonii.AAC.1
MCIRDSTKGYEVRAVDPKLTKEVNNERITSKVAGKVGPRVEFQPRGLSLPATMNETVVEMFQRGRVVDHASVNHFMSGHVNARGKLQGGTKLLVAAALRAVASMLATH